MKGLTYIIKNKLYVAVTNRTVCRSPFQLAGPSFKMPPSANFTALETEPDHFAIYEAIDNAFDNGMVGVSSMDSDEITFCGIGEPLLRLDTITEAAQLIIEKRHGAGLRIKTSGLIHTKDCSKVADTIFQSGINKISIFLGSDNPDQYNKLVQPTNGASFSDMCCFVAACVETGMDVSCTAVEAPGVNVKGVRELAYALGAPTFIAYKYHP